MATRTNKISYTSKDYQSILADMIASIPELSSKWTNFSEDDPGIALLKLIAYTADMLCYNMDFQVNECFPQTATQRANAAKLYRLIGYKMPWYRAAVTEASFRFNRPSDANGNIDISNKPITATINGLVYTYTLTTLTGSAQIDENSVLLRIICNENVIVSKVGNAFVAYYESGSESTPPVTPTYTNGVLTLTWTTAPDGYIASYVSLTAAGATPTVRLIIPNFTQFLTAENIPYVLVTSNVSERTLEIPATDSYVDSPAYTLVQGTVQRQVGINLTNIRNGRISIPYTTVDDDYNSNIECPHIVIQTTDYLGNILPGNDWKLVNDLNKVSGEGKYFEFNVDDNNMPYIQLCDNYADYLVGTSQALNLTYIVTGGEGYEVDEDEAQFKLASLLTAIDPVSGKQFPSIDLTMIHNDASTMGTNPPAPKDVVKYAFREATSLNTAITKRDYIALVESLSGILGGYINIYNNTVTISAINDTYTYLTGAQYQQIDNKLSNAIITVEHIINRVVDCNPVDDSNNPKAHTEIVPYNIEVLTKIPYTSGLQASIQDDILKTLTNQFSAVNFGSVVNYLNTALAVQSANENIISANIISPAADVPVNADATAFPRLGPVGVNIRGNSAYEHLKVLLADSDAMDDFYTTYIGTDNAVILTNYATTHNLQLTDAFSYDGNVYKVTWWCDRADLVTVPPVYTAGNWGQTNPDKIVNDTMVCLYPIFTYTDVTTNQTATVVDVAHKVNISLYGTLVF